ncbi:hypothetical protein [Desulfosarcina variabilis]|uniref:hypothetical protein n=1 Tax=Desulfosarcina variabilis TaxID=2300 RepID=UPI003AFB4F76
MKENKKRFFTRENDRRIQVCLHAPDWAEHARFEEDDEPCDDGRAAISCGNRRGEKPCTV